jgi:hypothetical protein
MRTRASICAKKKSYSDKETAIAAANGTDIILHPYRCDRCFRYHLTSRTKGRRIARPLA